MGMISVKILSTKSRVRYSVRRIVESAHASLRSELPGLQLEIREVSDSDEIMKYTQVLIAPGLVINEKLVYSLWIPRKEQVIGWLREALQEKGAR
jgi:hypothetical protein